MNVTEEDISRIFDKYRYCFEKNLPEPLFGIIHTCRYFGECTWHKWKNGEAKGVKISISDFYDWEEDKLEIVVVHEMIHYYIALYKIKDNDIHGEKFVELCNMFKEKCGLDITLTMDGTDFHRGENTSKLSWYLSWLFR